MNSKILKYIVIILLLIIFIGAFSASYTSHSIDNLAYVIAIGVDVADNKNNLKVTFQFADSSNFSSDGGSSDGPATIINSVESSSIDSAINLMNAYVGKELNLAHCKVIIFSEEVCKNGISNEVYSFINNTQIRPSTNFIVSRCNALYYIQNSKPILEKAVTKYYEIFPNSSKYTGYTANITLGQFFNRLTCKTCENVAILGGINTKEYDSKKDSKTDSDIMANESSIVGKRGTENLGLAVFREDSVVGELSALESIFFLLLRNELDSFLISIPSGENNEEYIDLSVNQYENNKVELTFLNGSPHIKVNVPLSAKIASIGNNSNYLNSNRLQEISNYAKSYLESNISSYLYKTSKEFKSDIHGFGKSALKYFATTKEWNDYNWQEHYKDAFFSVNVDINVKSSLLLTET